MGTAYGLNCKNCGYSFHASFGVGFTLPYVYEKTMEAAKNGELGEELQKFLAENLEGAIDASNAVSVCKKCGELESIQILDMYLPEKGFSLIKTDSRLLITLPFTNYGYVCTRNANVKYKLFAKYPRKCKRCGGEVIIFPEMPFKCFDCPHCHERLSVEGILDWD